MQAVIVFQWFFLQSTQWVSLYYFRKMYTMWFLQHLFCCHNLLTFKKFCKCVDHTFLVPNEAAWQSLERQQGIIVWSSSLYKEINLQIDKYFSINFSCFEHVEFLRAILWFWIFFVCSYLGASNFGYPPVFQM